MLDLYIYIYLAGGVRAFPARVTRFSADVTAVLALGLTRLLAPLTPLHADPMMTHLLALVVST